MMLHTNYHDDKKKEEAYNNCGKGSYIPFVQAPTRGLLDELSELLTPELIETLKQIKSSKALQSLIALGENAVNPND
jgi:hypothetical protein